MTCRQIALSLVVGFAARSAAVPGSSDANDSVEVVLDIDDECFTSEASPSCALNALQLKARKAFHISEPAESYKQCGGQGWTGPTTCPQGFTCVVYHETYSQCNPSPWSSSSALAFDELLGASTPAEPSKQCGGLGWTGPTTCQQGFACMVYNEAYSQCNPSSWSSASVLAIDEHLSASKPAEPSSSVLAIDEHLSASRPAEPSSSVLAVDELMGASRQAEAFKQCGGQEWTGPTTCPQGFTCVVYHETYSQCNPSPWSSASLLIDELVNDG